MHKHIEETITTNFPDQLEYSMRDPILFGDYRNAMSEDEPRDYEDLLDYDAVFHLFQEVLYISYSFNSCCLDFVFSKVF